MAACRVKNGNNVKGSLRAAEPEGRASNGEGWSFSSEEEAAEGSLPSYPTRL